MGGTQHLGERPQPGAPVRAEQRPLLGFQFGATFRPRTAGQLTLDANEGGPVRVVVVVEPVGVDEAVGVVLRRLADRLEKAPVYHSLPAHSPSGGSIVEG